MLRIVKMSLGAGREEGIDEGGRGHGWFLSVAGWWLRLSWMSSPYFGIEMHHGRIEGARKAVPVDLAPVHRVGEKIDEVGVGVIVGVGGYGLLAADGPFLVAQGHGLLPSTWAR
jgi:hypothetical protein